jgi:hypothetical protein
MLSCPACLQGTSKFCVECDQCTSDPREGKLASLGNIADTVSECARIHCVAYHPQLVFKEYQALASALIPLD